MSVLVPDMHVFEYVQSGFIYCANHKTCDSLYSSSISFSSKAMGIDSICNESKRWVKNLLTLNCKSYAARYRENELGDLAHFYKENNHSVNAFQLLKYLECIHYNIEMKTIEDGYTVDTIKFVLTEQDRKDFQLLESFISDLKNSIISNLPEYQNAKYAD